MHLAIPPEFHIVEGYLSGGNRADISCADISCADGLTACVSGCFIRLLRKLAPDEEMQGTYEAADRSLQQVPENFSTGVMQQLPSGVEFSKKSIIKIKVMIATSIAFI